ncbi:hypothetical protein F5X99DRAFT_431590 [Biscogniauxia marginata]|nr:hypothetical protein F5X99DRAFT_431590 [Biscogniauxia marginata]
MKLADGGWQMAGGAAVGAAAQLAVTERQQPGSPVRLTFHQASRGGHHNISPWKPPSHSPFRPLVPSSPAAAHHVSASETSSQPNHYFNFDFDWGNSYALLGSVDNLFQSIGVGSLAEPPFAGTVNGDGWLYGLDGGSTTMSIGGGGGGGMEEWSVPSLASSANDTPILGTAMPAGDLDDLLPACDSTFLFNQPPPPTALAAPQLDSSIPTTSTATTATMSNVSNAFPTSPPSAVSSSSRQGGQTQQPDYNSSSSNSNKRRSPQADDVDDVDPVTALKRQRNNVAARKYRQKRIDRINELETELQEIKEERDDLRLRLARQEAEAAALRSMLQMNSNSKHGKGAEGAERRS